MAENNRTYFFNKQGVYVYQFITPEDKFENNYPFTCVITVINCKNINIDVEPAVNPCSEKGGNTLALKRTFSVVSLSMRSRSRLRLML